MRNKSLQIFVVLGAVCLFSGGALAIMYNFTKTPIYENQQAELKNAIVKVLPSVKNYKEIKKTEIITIYKGEDEKGKTIAAAPNDAPPAASGTSLPMSTRGIITSTLSLYRAKRKTTYVAYGKRLQPRQHAHVFLHTFFPVSHET